MKITMKIKNALVLLALAVGFAAHADIPCTAMPNNAKVTERNGLAAPVAVAMSQTLLPVAGSRISPTTNLPKDSGSAAGAH